MIEQDRSNIDISLFGTNQQKNFLCSYGRAGLLERISRGFRDRAAEKK
jgi:hypothetical protein